MNHFKSNHHLLSWCSNQNYPMAHPRDVLVITTSSVEGSKIKKYIKPVSAHIVAGTNFFSDFFASFSDVFGGRSQTYQSQLTSLYNEAIERIKFAAYELGANCILGLQIDMDEISGKGKSMFILTAIGTAVILEKEVKENTLIFNSDEKLENVSVERINALRNKKAVIEKAEAGSLKLTDEVWNFITANQVDEVYSYLLKKWEEALLQDAAVAGSSTNFSKLFIGYIDALPDSKKQFLLYNSLKDEENEQIAYKLAEIIRDQNLFDFDKSIELLHHSNFKVRKRGLRVVTYDKAFYNKEDLQHLQNIRDLIKITFVERGAKTMKKQLLSSKEKEVWNCECGKTNDLGTYCNGCGNDIYGFKANEVKPVAVDNFIAQKVELISEYVS